MAECVYIESRLGTLWVGQLAEYNEYEVGVNGLFPNTTQCPTVIPMRTIIDLVSGYNIGAIEQAERFLNASFGSMEDVSNALQSDLFNLLLTDVFWIWGSPDTGGLGACWDGSYVVFIMINGFELSNDLYKVGYGSNILYPNVGATTTITQGEHATQLLPAIPPSGTYDTGISFYYVYDWDANYKALMETSELRISFNTILPSKAGYLDIITASTSFEYYTTVYQFLGTDWQWCFDNSLPPDNMLERNTWVNLKNMQYCLTTKPLYFIRIDRPYVENTNAFGGESVVIDEEGNPYEVVDPSGGSGGIGGGGGPQDRYSQDTLPEGHPNITLLNSGFVKLYNPNYAQLQNFAHFLFADITDEMSIIFKRMISNPLDYIIALNMIHIPLTTGTTEEIGFCGIGSNVSAKVVTEQYYEIEYRLDIREFWNTALDYSNYTKCKIYIPYCGIYDINIDEIMNGTLWLRYVVDVVSGSVVAFVGTRRTQKDGTVLRATLYQYNGNCILAMPVSSTNWQNTFSSILNIASMAIAPSPSSVAGMANNIMGQKATVQKSGSISANFGYLGKQTPYIILERPELSIPVNYGRHEGYPANHKRKLSEVHGYTEIKADTLIANGFTGTSEELDLLKQALQEGAYLE